MMIVIIIVCVCAYPSPLATPSCGGEEKILLYPKEEGQNQNIAPACGANNTSEAAASDITR
jgi:hypothetical protein